MKVLRNQLVFLGSDSNNRLGSPPLLAVLNLLPCYDSAKEFKFSSLILDFSDSIIRIHIMVYKFYRMWYSSTKTENEISTEP